MITARADVVGSLLRPAWLLEAQRAFAAGMMAQSAFKRIEDRAVDEAVALQEEAGLGVVTDGEMRRQSFQAQMMEAVEGFGERTLDALVWGEWRGPAEVGDSWVPRPASLGVVSRLTRRRHIAAEEFTYLRARATNIP
ncbi:MAG: methionine synthase, partial [Candidatus Methylomirabilia bacterium]